jgi:uncharacterized lipoprotein YmbA
MSGRIRRFLAIVAMGVWLAGCGALEPRADPSSYYILAALPEADFAADNNTAGVKANFSMGLGPVELPAYLERQQIATRTSTNRLSYSETDRWAAPLAESFSSVLGQNIAHLLNTARLIPFPWQSIDAPDYQLKIEVLQFEATSNQEAWLTARWSVIDRNKKILLDQRLALKRRASSLSTEDFVKALSATVGELSREIVKTLQTLDKQGKP